MDRTYVRLDDNNLDYEVLVREIKESYFEKTFGDIIAYMGDDSIYKESGEKDLAKWFRNIYENANKENYEVAVFCKTSDEPSQDLVVGLEDRLSDHMPRILKLHKSSTGDNVKIMDITIETNCPCIID